MEKMKLLQALADEAVELRRERDMLLEVNASMLEGLRDATDEVIRLREINKELVEALKMIRSKDISLLDKNVINNLIFKADTA